MVTIGLLRMCELAPPAIAAHGDYVTVFRDFFRDHTIELFDIPVHEGATPDSAHEFDVWVVSGSEASVFEDLRWIRTAEDIVRQLIAAERPTFGICFGHQLMAQALGGRVERAGVGWGLGAHRYDVIEPPAWMSTAPPSVGVLALHQDQVVEPPPDTTVWATSDFCPVAGLTFGDRAWSIQPHPEFTPRLVEALCRERRDQLGRDATDAALASLGEPLDGQLFAGATVGG